MIFFDPCFDQPIFEFRLEQPLTMLLGLPLIESIRNGRIVEIN